MEKKWITKPSSILLIALIVGVLWGSAYPAVKVGFDLFGIATEDSAAKILFAGIRFFAAGIMVVAYASLTERRLIRPTRAELPKVAVLGLILTTAQYIFYYIGLAHCQGAKAAILFSSGTFVAVLTTPLIIRGEKLTLRKAIGCVIGFAGVITVNGLTADALGGMSIQGEGFLIIAALCFGLGSTWSKRVTAGSDPVVVTGYQLLIGGAVLLLASPFIGAKITVITPAGVALLAYMAFLSAAAFTLWTLLLKFNDAGKVMVYNFLVPIFGALLSGLFLHEAIFTLRNLIALVLVCAGIIIVNLALPEQK